MTVFLKQKMTLQCAKVRQESISLPIVALKHAFQYSHLKNQGVLPNMLSVLATTGASTSILPVQNFLQLDSWFLDISSADQQSPTTVLFILISEHSVVHGFIQKASALRRFIPATCAIRHRTLATALFLKHPVFLSVIYSSVFCPYRQILAKVLMDFVEVSNAHAIILFSF